MSRIKKVALISSFVALVSSTAVIDQLPLPLLQWSNAALQRPQLLSLISGSPHTYDGVRVSHIYPVPGRLDVVLVTFPGSFMLHTDLYPPPTQEGITWPMAHSSEQLARGVWVMVHESRWDLFEEVGNELE